MLERWRADLLHGGPKLEPQEFERTFDSGLAESTETPQIRSADADALGAHAERLDDVGTAAEPGIDQHRHRPRDLDDLSQRLDRGAAVVIGAPAMVRHDDRVDASLGGDLGIFPGHDALEQNLELGHVAQALDVIPAHRRGLNAPEP